MKTNPTRFWWIVIALGWIFDFLFWKQTPGINFPLYVLLCLSTGFLLLRSDGHRPARSVWLLLPLIAFFAFIIFIRQEPMTVSLAVFLSMFLMGVLAVSFLGGRWLSYSLLDYLGKFLQLALSMITRPLGFNAELKQGAMEGSSESEPHNGGGQGRARTWQVVRGVLIALPILAIFASLLASADQIFSQKLQEFIELFNLEKMPEYIFRMVYILIGAYLLAGIFLHAASNSRDEKLVGEEKPAIPAFLGFLESVIVLSSVTVLFATFVAVQFQYFFGGQTNIQIDGFTYSEYARRGFGELITVAFFSLLLILSASGVTRRKTEAQRRVFSGLGIGIVALVLIMLVSAFQRLMLYETAYGFSRLRAYTHVFMIWLGLLLVAVVVLEILRRERAFALAAILAGVGFAASLGLMNVDAFIVRENVNRTLQGQEFDATYLMELSNDAIPALASAYRSQNLPASVKEGLGAVLACYDVNRNPDDLQPTWRSFHLARWNAGQILNSLQADFDQYEVDESDWPHHIITPSGKEYFCSRYWD